MNFRYTTENKIKSADFKKIKDGEISEYQVKIEFEEECSPSVFSISWEEDHVDMYGFWSSKSFHQHNISPDWWMRTNESKTASGIKWSRMMSSAFIIAFIAISFIYG